MLSPPGATMIHNKYSRWKACSLTSLRVLTALRRSSRVLPSHRGPAWLRQGPSPCECPTSPVATHLDDQDAHPNLSDGSFFLSSCPGFMGPFVAALFSPPPTWFRERSHCTYYAFLFIDFFFPLSSH